MLEYVLFNQEFVDTFTASLSEAGCAFLIGKDPIDDEAKVIQIDDLDDDALWDRLDELYDELSEQDRLMMEAEGGDDAMSTAGIYIDLKRGGQTLAKVDPGVMNRMLTVVSMDEFNTFIERIVHSVETPEVSPLCKKEGLG